MTRHLSAFLASGIVVLAAAACASSTAARSHPGTVIGRVLAAPACPGPARAGHPCPPAAVSGATVSALKAGHVVASATSDRGGRFSVSVPAGHYVIRATNAGGYPSTAQRRVTVTRGTAVHVTLTVDSGLR